MSTEKAYVNGRPGHETTLDTPSIPDYPNLPPQHGSALGGRQRPRHTPRTRLRISTVSALGSAELPCSAPPDMISLLFYCLVLHTSYPSVVRISIVMLSGGAWSGLASIAGVALLSRISRITLVTRSSGVALLSRISRITLVTRSSGVACVPPVTRLACIPRLSLLSGLPLRAILSGRSRLCLRCRCCRCCLRWRCLATAA